MKKIEREKKKKNNKKLRRRKIKKEAGTNRTSPTSILSAVFIRRMKDLKNVLLVVPHLPRDRSIPLIPFYHYSLSHFFLSACLTSMITSFLTCYASTILLSPFWGQRPLSGIFPKGHRGQHLGVCPSVHPYVCLSIHSKGGL